MLLQIICSMMFAAQVFAANTSYHKLDFADSEPAPPPARPAPAAPQPPERPPAPPAQETSEFQRDAKIASCLDLTHERAAPLDKVGNKEVLNPNAAQASCAIGGMAGLKKALQNQMAACDKKPREEKNATFRFGCRKVPMEIYCIRTNQKLLEMANAHKGELPEFINKVREKFSVYLSDGKGGGKTRYTGYNAPVGSEIKMTENENEIPKADRVPLYAPPSNMVQLSSISPNACGEVRGSGDPNKWCLYENGKYQAMPSAEAIRNGALGAKAPIIGYMNRKQFDYLLMEGAGEIAVKRKSGQTEHMKINFGGRNGGQPNKLNAIERCAGRTVSRDEAKLYNDELVFWKLGGNEFHGVDEIPLVQDHVIATHPTATPTGTVNLVFAPGSNGCARMATASDIGSKIEPGHNDVYTGTGPEGKTRAGPVTGMGESYMILPKDLPASTLIPGCKN